MPGKVFLTQMLGLTSMEVAVGQHPRGRAVRFKHRHRQSEELYLFIQGRGQFGVDGETIDVKEGTGIRVAPAGARSGARRESIILNLDVDAVVEPDFG